MTQINLNKACPLARIVVLAYNSVLVPFHICGVITVVMSVTHAVEKRVD